ncbi:Abortive infection protein [Methanothermus fervidus DSM 2088]|uniref:Abortive infection protein n=1 Tax=Methanothermus fervidus (strain ATCC 43054 / DSM 2088 / JCM 10308 / V24 S) TaxID=523846 RepID=E3GW76_METFV|nr:type II CAAX endopeptidase family protein [Methanothermus fervidus]ADP77841.1 Abortive infection protein [Methanothermus fervidus DSM 2088]
MSKFLLRVKEGKNEWWRYLITIILTFGSPIIPGMFLGIVFVFTQNFQILKSSLFLLILLGITYFTSFIFFCISVRYIHGRKLISLVNSYNKIRWKRIFKGAIIWFLILIITDIIIYFINPANYKFNYSSTFFLLLLLSLIIFPVQATFEELFFRGYLMQALSLKFKKPLTIILITSIIFGILHWFNAFKISQSFSIAMAATILGIILGIVTISDEGIELAVGVHIINNIYASSFHSSYDVDIGNLPSLITSPYDPIFGIIHAIMMSLMFLAIIKPNLSVLTSSINQVKEVKNHDTYFKTNDRR